eukprot:TRINITY_DN13939_c0_g1_i3.p1 TRINITY_DN13939_c0_g1~~TRINITY_DN13939_c0_g1_i3.p1  ORF type:complete len:279 (-),score=64.16 TRINITY_DN13939_c0_g1_i3:388-1224(-)
MLRSLVGSEMCIRDSINAEYGGLSARAMPPRAALSRVDQNSPLRQRPEKQHLNEVGQQPRNAPSSRRQRSPMKTKPRTNLAHKEWSLLRAACHEQSYTLRAKNADAVARRMGHKPEVVRTKPVSATADWVSAYRNSVRGAPPVNLSRAVERNHKVVEQRMARQMERQMVVRSCAKRNKVETEAKVRKQVRGQNHVILRNGRALVWCSVPLRAHNPVDKARELLKQQLKKAGVPRAGMEHTGAVRTINDTTLVQFWVPTGNLLGAEQRTLASNFMVTTA